MCQALCYYADWHLPSMREIVKTQVINNLTKRECCLKREGPAINWIVRDDLSDGK